jgi:hypothetical protein
VSISPECISKFNELKLNKKIKYIMYKLSDDYKEIVVEEASENGDWDHFREKLVNAQSKTKTVRYPHILQTLKGREDSGWLEEWNRARLERAQDTLSTTSTTTWLPARVQEARSHSSHGLQMMPVSR